MLNMVGNSADGTSAMPTGRSAPSWSPAPTSIAARTCCRCGRHEVPTDHHDLGPGAGPADELAALSAQRWEIESIFDELNTHQRGPRLILRSRTPEGVYQGAWGYLCVHYALRALIHGAAHDHDLDPDRISFTAALHAARRSIRTGLSQTVNLASTLRRATSELLHGLFPKRRQRANARVVRRKMSNYNVKRAQHRNWPTPGMPIGSAIRIPSPPKVMSIGLRPRLLRLFRRR